MFGLDDAALGMIAAGAISSAGAVYTNSQNRKFQGEVNQESINLANTAHQREIADLKAAGLNPILSASGSGASVPSLGVASQINPGEGIAEGISSASKLFSQEYKANVDNLKSNTEHTNLINDAQRYENIVKSHQSMLETINIATKQELANIEKLAIDEVLGIKRNYDGSVNVNYEKFNAVKDLYKEGIISDLKMRANENMRANISSATDIANGASDIALKGKKIKTKPLPPKRPIRVTVERKK